LVAVFPKVYFRNFFRNRPILHVVADQPGQRSLRSDDTSRLVLVVPSVRLSTVDNQAFPVDVVGHVSGFWNNLPPDATSTEYCCLHFAIS